MSIGAALEGVRETSRGKASTEDIESSTWSKGDGAVHSRKSQ